MPLGTYQIGARVNAAIRSLHVETEGVLGANVFALALVDIIAGVTAKSVETFVSVVTLWHRRIKTFIYILAYIRGLLVDAFCPKRTRHRIKHSTLVNVLARETPNCVDTLATGAAHVVMKFALVNIDTLVTAVCIVTRKANFTIMGVIIALVNVKANEPAVNVHTAMTSRTWSVICHTLVNVNALKVAELI